MAILKSSDGAASPQSKHKPINVLVTGYGPFLDQFPINSSGEIADRLPSTLPPTSTCPYEINLHIPREQLRVAYHEIITKVPQYLKHPPTTGSTIASAISENAVPPSETSSQHIPDLVLHMGLAPGRRFFTLETQSQKGPYDKYPDVDGEVFTPEQNQQEFSPEAPFYLTTTLDCEDVWRRWNTAFSSHPPNERPDLRTGTKDSVGNYLCGFVYYYSLHWYWARQHYDFKGPGEHGNRPVIFMHVPHLPTKNHLDQGVEVAIGLIRAMVMNFKEGKMASTEEEEEGVKKVMKEDLELAMATRREATVTYMRGTNLQQKPI